MLCKMSYNDPTLFLLRFTNILKIIVFLFGSIKISCIFVKEITTKTKQKW